MQLDSFPRVSLLYRAVLTVSLLVIPLGVCSTVYANGTIYPFEEARKVADSEMIKRGYKLSEWKLHLDPSNSEWTKVSDIRRNSPVPAAREYFQKQESKLQGKTFWSFHYEYKTRQGVTTKDGMVWLFVSADTGDLLLVIPPGH